MRAVASYQQWVLRQRRILRLGAVDFIIQPIFVDKWVVGERMEMRYKRQDTTEADQMHPETLWRSYAIRCKHICRITGAVVGIIGVGHFLFQYGTLAFGESAILASLLRYGVQYLFSSDMLWGVVLDYAIYFNFLL